MDEYTKVLTDLEDLQEYAGQLSGRLSDHCNIKMAYRYQRSIKRIKDELYNMWMRLEH